MIKLLSLIKETRIIDPIASLLVGDITLYHGTTLSISKKAKMGELGPTNLKQKIKDMFKDLNVSEQDYEYILHNCASSWRIEHDPNVLFLTTRRKDAENYAKTSTKYGGEIFSDIVRAIYRNVTNPVHPTNEPAVITITVPLQLVYTHPFWKTPLKQRIKSVLQQMKRYENNEDIYNYIREMNFECFVYEPIPARYIQRIDLVK